MSKGGKTVAFGAQPRKLARQADDWVSNRSTTPIDAGEEPRSALRAVEAVPAPIPAAAVPETSAPTPEAVPAAKARPSRLTLDLPESLHRRIKVQCASQGKRINEVLLPLLERTFPEA